MKDQKQLTPGESEVEERLRSAARTLRRLPNVKVQGYFSTWPTIIREPLEILQMEPEPMRMHAIHGRHHRNGRGFVCLAEMA
jgi:hypothetical protein